MTSCKITMAVDGLDAARTLTGALTDLIEPAPDALTLFEAEAGWVVEGYYPDLPDIEELARRLGAVLPFPVPRIVETAVPDENWVAVSQAALPPVTAGRFTVYGSHDRGLVPRGPNTLLIDAGEAFGTAHHATTQGCLIALDRLTRRRRFARVLDLGCGSGVLAIAAARALPRALIEASDNDPQAIAVAGTNARVNGVAGRIRLRIADGLPRGRTRESRYDLILANILADPLVELAPGMARALAAGGVAVLSGLLVRQAAAVAAAYRSHGLVLASHRRQAGWSTLTLVRRRSAGRSPSDPSTLSA
ncbi:MAG: 50S ribosomal protein L11 methyltransferase [Hyphomicrobiaceae bacterium]|nr:50S ribosomal protein L11 methyltransferase [Hyphomicrobiaceae bacterium]